MEEEKLRDKKVIREEMKIEREGILQQLDDWLETPMLVLSIVWLGLFVYELLYELNAYLEVLGIIIWGLFIVEFAIKLVIAPKTIQYLKNNWLIGISLILPAFRVFRILRVFRIFQASRGLRLVRLLASLNIGMNALGESFRRRGFKYVLLVTLFVIFGGAAGMYVFEPSVEIEGGFKSYGEALWWTAMLMTTLGGEHIPQTVEGRILNFVLALYAFVSFGYITATLATFFVESDAKKREEEKAEIKPTLRDLEKELGDMRAEIRELLDKGNTKLATDERG